jgi:hypothetical protein
MRRLNIKTQDDDNEEYLATAQPKKLNLLNAIEQIIELSFRSSLNEEFFENAKKYIHYVSKKLGVSPIQSVLFSLFINFSDDSCITLSDMASHLGCRMIKMIRCENDIDVLVEKGMIVCHRDSSEKNYRVTLHTLECLKNDSPIVPIDRHGLTCEELFSEFEKLFEQMDDNELNYETLLKDIHLLLNDNSRLKFVRKLKSYDLDDMYLVLFIFFCHLFVVNNDDHIIPSDFECLFTDMKSFFREQKRSLLNGTHPLIEMKLVEYAISDGFADRESYKLTEKTKRDFLSELNIACSDEGPKVGLLMHEELKEKKLFFNKPEAEQLKQLSSMLQPKQFTTICQRLEENNMRKGFACLFYGEPGTGKTESVYQLAKASGRNIMQVNFAELRSMWVGESEKNVKLLFDKYRGYVESSAVAPILFFNEADGIINKRRGGAESAVDKMENTIQNIILQEIENLDGILIATTNLTENLDRAFERRFLYKIKFGKPHLEAKKAIWQTMIPELNDNDSTELASCYPFSGGQIENIARKRTVSSILTGKTIDLQTIKSYCDEELIVNEKRSRIGFL